MVISFSGLGESEACWTRRFIRGIGERSLFHLFGKTLILETGASHAPTFSKKTTHLLCPSSEGPKAEKALEWRVPVVDMAWLEGLVVSKPNSPTAEGGANLLVPPDEECEGGAVEPEQMPVPESVPQGALFRLSTFFF
jgi:hypothetical protein